MGERMTDDAQFQTLLRRVLDGIATREERDAFAAALDGHPERIAEYVRLAELVAAAACLGEGGAFSVEAGKAEDGGRQAADGSGGTWKKAWWKVAAAAAVVAAPVLQTTTARRGEELASFAQVTAAKGVGRLASDLRSPAIGLVVLVREVGAEGLELPGRLPGTVRLEKGQATVRLGSGVVLTLLGPLELEVRDAMQVRLADGRLLASVPSVASGFTVRTRELEVWDIGTVFGVSAEDGRSDVFVFKGSVQVSEASGERVDLCGAGEGVRAVEGQRPFKFAADWSDARKVFATVRGTAALGDPEMAFSRAVKIAGMWSERYAPEEAWRIRERGARAAAARAAAKRPPFRTSWWVRPSVPVFQKESDMKTTQAVAVFAAAMMTTGAETAAAYSEAVPVYFAPHLNRHWTTAFTNEVPLQWRWPAAAVSATLAVEGMNGAFTTNFTEVTSGCVWQAFPGVAPASEDVYTLTLTFRDAGGLVVHTQEARLAVVAGSFGAAAVDTGPSARGWGKAEETVVTPDAAGRAEATSEATASQLVIAKESGVSQTNLLADASGYFGWKLKNGGWGSGAFGLSLTFPGTAGEWTAALTYVSGGTILSVR